MLVMSNLSGLRDINFLHALVRYNPPIDIVAKMIQVRPDLILTLDHRRRTALHIASANRSSAPLIRLLSQAYPEACTMQDDEGKTPLHLACDSSNTLRFWDRELFRQPSYEVIKELLCQGLDAAYIEDIHEANPLEYAIISEVPIDIIVLLQTSMSTMQKKRKEIVYGDTKSINAPSRNHKRQRCEAVMDQTTVINLHPLASECDLGEPSKLVRLVTSGTSELNTPNSCSSR